MKISGFTFIHNSIAGGYPLFEAIEAVTPYVDEIVVVDMASTDGTRERLEKIPWVKVLPSPWGKEARLAAWELRKQCQGDVTIFFEADEVYDNKLVYNVRKEILRGNHNLAVYRLQLEQNFQRCKWYPIPVHRVFPTGQGSYHLHPVNCPEGVKVLPPEMGFMWDISGCFRDNQQQRKANQAILFGQPRHMAVPIHFTLPYELSENEEQAHLTDSLWTWKTTPFDIPMVLKLLVGMTKYEPTV